MTASTAITGTFAAVAAAINGACDCVGVAAWRIKCGFVSILNGIDDISDHRVTSLFLWVVYFGVQDLLKDPDVQTVIASPAAIESWAASTWIFIAFKASLPMLGGIITYKSDTWARKGQSMPDRK